MSGAIRPATPAGHPVRATLHALAERGLGQRDICDEASALYVSNMMAELLRTDDLFRIRDDRGRRLEHLADLVAVAESTADAAERKRRHRYLGDFTLFMLGLFPESLDRPRRAIGCDYFQQQGRRSYNIVADLALTDAEPDLLRRLSGRSEEYVRGLNRVKLYIEDPFFRYMFREFGIT
jgi:hypothetical protein